MHWVTAIWSMSAAACLTLAALNLLIWFKDLGRREHLVFVVGALAAAVLAGLELTLMYAASTGEYGQTMRLGHIPFTILIVSIVCFLRLRLRAGRLWLAWVVCGLRTLALGLNFVFTPNLNFREITSLRTINVLGESVSAPVGVTNPWTLIGQLSMLLLFAFCVDATMAVWRRGDRRLAMVVGGSAGCFVLLSLVQAVLVIWGVIHAPFTYSLFYLCIILAMGFELSHRVLHSALLARRLQGAEAELRESEQRMDLVAEAANLGVWVRDPARNEVWGSNRWRALFGFTESERLDFEAVLQRVHPDDREALRHILAETHADRGRYEHEYRLLLPDGRVRWIASRGGVQSTGGDSSLRMRGVSVDITARKSAEAEVQRQRAELAHVARASTMGQLASSLAHELNQPLGAILRNAEAAQLLLQGDPPDLEEVRAILDDICQDDQRAGGIIDRTRAMLVGREVVSTPLVVKELVEGSAALVRPDSSIRHVNVRIELAPGLPSVRGDRVQLQQVLVNLMLNGMDAMSDTPAEARWLVVRAGLTDDNAIEFAVSDSGSGIPAERLARVFDSFFTTKPNGLGMGLPISRTIIEAHGGRLFAENNADRGATFRFRLPAADVGAPT